MAEKIEDRLRQTSTSTGVGDFVLSGTPAGFRAFSTKCSIGDTFHGVIVAVDSSGVPTGDWETGFYTYSALNTVARTTVRSSSASGDSLVSFGPGTKVVFLDLTAYQIKRFAVASATGQAAAPFGQSASAYTALTFQEEFSGTTMDTSKWTTDIWTNTNNATQNFRVANGNLDIYPQTDASGSWFDRNWTTDNTNAVPKFSQQYGYFEIEAKMPVGAGLSPRLGLINRDGHELIIAEFLSGAPLGGWSTADLHPIDYSMTRVFGSGVDDQRLSSFVTPANIPDLSAAFHKYAMRWDATTLRWFYDGVQVGPTLSHTTMTVPMFFYVGLRGSSEETSRTVGSGTLSSSNKYTPQGTTNSLSINYVRAWQIAP